ncbi:hypothetical protein HG535_0G03440 [Zygotorulaspora mrakii]|uniref:Bile pigment transporter 1 n=1 Tax=Zygotorulaspora mrakii TaxID=42260 RepID=A0A7H9B6Z0_ZYGMR|nr:uncharacterized protein HG535_0G03440 [Zygotorulaspora mrakii]QLG74461.1 hypothetical protein HG535_0G03440 [Zygotorulaspora mrakii]
MSTSLNQCQYGYRPYIDSSTNAINPCFFSLINLIQGGFFFIIGFIQLVQLCKEPRAPSSINYHSVSTKLFYQLTNIGLQGVLVLCELVFISQPTEIYPSVLHYSLTVHLLFDVFISLPTKYLEYFKCTCAIGNQLFYYMIQMMVLALQLTLRLVRSPDERFNLIRGQTGAIFEVIILLNSIIIFLNEFYFYEPSSELLRFYDEKGYPRDNNILQNVTFTWMNDLITDTYSQGEIPNPRNLPTLPADLNIEIVSKNLQSKWETEKWRGRNSLFKALSKTFGKTILIAISYQTLKDLLSVLQPQLLRMFILCFNNDREQIYPPINGMFIAFGLFFTTVLSTFLQNHYYIRIFEVGLGMKGSLIAMIYQKSLKLSLSSRESRSTGDILNMASTDANKIQKFFEDCQVIFGAPVKATVVIISLYSFLGKAIFAGLATMAVMIPINTLISKRVKKLYKTQMEYKDSRLKTTNEIIGSIKSIKLYAWEMPMLDRLNHIRNDLEIQNFKKIGIVSNLIVFLWNSVPLIVTCSTFGLFSLQSETPLSPEIVFPSLALFNILNDAIYSLPSIINSIIETKVSMDRLTAFLLSEELDESFIYFEEEQVNKLDPVVEISNATFLWNSLPRLKDEQNEDFEAIIESPRVALANIYNFQVPKGAITCITGRVGSGKSTLLRAILGQLPCISAENTDGNPKVIIRASSIAYCAQEPWIFNGTIRENILFGHRFDENYYHATISACQLLPDLDVLPNGDKTLVGEKGISLSGGQKARVSLARAVFARSDLYILDDVLSAVDTEVRTNIINQVLDQQSGLLKKKSIILATNTLSVLKNSQKIYVLQMGRIAESGTYAEAISNEKITILHKLLNEFDLNLKKAPDPQAAIQESVRDGYDSILEENRESSMLTHPMELEEEVSEQLNSRRASIESFKSPLLTDYEDSKTTNNQQIEKIESGRVKASVYLFYIKACGITGCVLFLSFLILSRLFDLIENLWLKRWSEANEKNGSNQDVLKFVAIYALIGICSAAFNNLRTIVMLFFCSIKGSKVLHDTMAKNVMRAPMSFFETTPTGRILNRFSSDMQAVDSSLQWIFSFFFRSISNYLLTVVLISYNMPQFLAFNTLLLVVYMYYQSYYITLSRELKRLNSVSVSPIMSLIGETLEGHVVINAFNQLKRFNFLNFCNVQYNVDCNYHLRSTNRWLSVRLETIGAFTVLTTALLALSTIESSKKISPGMVGLLMSYALQVTSSLLWIVRMTVQIETNIVSVERIYEYCNLPSEAPEIIADKRVSKYWPEYGKIVFKDYCTRYRKGLQPVLKNLTMKIKPQEKIGIVGRTGAGKSTFSLALFRLLEATEGSIEIDGTDISSIGLSDLRSHLGIIPQEAEAFEGTVRSNLDPFNQYSDDELWKAITLSHLRPQIARMLGYTEELPQSFDKQQILEAKINARGSNLSVGERQLLCLSRALLNKSKILVFDEATAAVDVETDKIIQKTIRSELKDRTILTIAHRLDTILDCDKILVLDKGEIKEFDTPANLLSNSGSMFYSLYQKNM